MEMAKITGKGQVTIPKSVRDDLDVNDGDRIVFIKNKKGYTIVNEKTIESGEYFIN